MDEVGNAARPQVGRHAVAERPRNEDADADPGTPQSPEPASASGALEEIDGGDGHQRDVDADRKVVGPVVVDDHAVNVEPLYGVHLREEIERERADECAAAQSNKPQVDV